MISGPRETEVVHLVQTLDLGSPWASFGHPFGSLWLPLGCLLAPFGIFWLPLGSIGAGCGLPTEGIASGDEISPRSCRDSAEKWYILSKRFGDSSGTSTLWLRLGSLGAVFGHPKHLIASGGEISPRSCRDSAESVPRTLQESAENPPYEPQAKSPFALQLLRKDFVRRQTLRQN